MPLAASRAERIKRDLSGSGSLSAGSSGTGEHKYFFAINLYNSFDVIPDIFATLFRTASVLGYHNVFVSIYENGSNDQTKSLLKIFDALARTVGLRVIIRTSMRTRGQFNHRIEYLAEVRNAAMTPLHELRDAEGEVFDTIIFMNDILPCVDDLLELVWQSRRQNAGITCAADYMYHDDIVSVLCLTQIPRQPKMDDGGSDPSCRTRCVQGGSSTGSSHSTEISSAEIAIAAIRPANIPGRTGVLRQLGGKRHQRNRTGKRTFRAGLPPHRIQSSFPTTFAGTGCVSLALHCFEIANLPDWDQNRLS